MNIFHRKSLLAACIAAMIGLHGYAQKNEASPRLSDYFSPATTNTMSPDSEGFIQRWSDELQCPLILHEAHADV